MSKRFTHHDDDRSRLPEGFRRIGYDSDTRRYTFEDEHGNLYLGEPGSEYGVLTPVTAVMSSMAQTRPSAFASSNVRRSTIPAGAKDDIPKTFHDILPSDLITSSSLSNTSGQAASQSTGDQFVNLVRKSTLPKMQGVVHSLRRSVTSMRRPRLPSGTAPGAGSDSETKSRSIFRRKSKLSNSSAVYEELSSSAFTSTKDSGNLSVPVHPSHHS